jgi:hypothetical protein
MVANKRELLAINEVGARVALQVLLIGINDTPGTRKVTNASEIGSETDSDGSWTMQSKNRRSDPRNTMLRLIRARRRNMTAKSAKPPSEGLWR